MGNLELQLLMKYGLPLAVKLLGEGKTTEEARIAVEAVKVVSSVAGGDAVGALLKADDKQVDGIVEGLFGVLTGVGDAVGGLLKAIGGLFG